MIEFLGCQRNGDKHKQPKQWVATDLLKEQASWVRAVSLQKALVVTNKTKVQ